MSFSKSAQLTSTKQKKKPKEHNKSWYSKKLDEVFSKVVRTRDGKCLRCGKTENLQCNHIAGRKHLAGRWSEHNAITLCYRCHIHFWHKEVTEASEWLKQTFPSVWQESLEVKKQIYSPTLEDYVVLYDQLKTRLKVLEEHESD